MPLLNLGYLAREHFDYWQMILYFTNASGMVDRSFTSPRLFNPLGVEDKKPTLNFELHEDMFMTSVNSRIDATVCQEIHHGLASVH